MLVVESSAAHTTETSKRKQAKIQNKRRPPDIRTSQRWLERFTRLAKKDEIITLTQLRGTLSWPRESLSLLIPGRCRSELDRFNSRYSDSCTRTILNGRIWGSCGR